MAKKTVKKRINSKRKGNNAELELVNIFNDKFGAGMFARVGVASGARAKNTKLPKHAAGVMTGDVITPDFFRFSIESKSANINVDFLEKSEQFDDWLGQASTDAQSVDRIPMLCWKQYRKGWVVALPARSFKECGYYGSYYHRYGQDTERWKWGWIVLRLAVLLELNQEHDFWYKDRE